MKKKKRSPWLWVIKAFIYTFFLTALFSFISAVVLSVAQIAIAVTVLLIIILIGIVFDIIGIAIATADIKPFISMSSKKIRGAGKCIEIINKADFYTNVCNDIIGDICGIISGAAGTAIALRLVTNEDSLVAAIVVSSLTAAVTVGCKAAGKRIGINRNKEIVLAVGKVLSVFSVRN
jgi:CBS domain containing-hemolysin-like protein